MYFCVHTTGTPPSGTRPPAPMCAYMRAYGLPVRKGERICIHTRHQSTLKCLQIRVFVICGSCYVITCHADTSKDTQNQSISPCLKWRSIYPTTNLAAHARVSHTNFRAMLLQSHMKRRAPGIACEETEPLYTYVVLVLIEKYISYTYERYIVSL